MKSYQKTKSIIPAIIIAFGIATIIVLAISSVTLGHKLNQTQTQLTKAKKQNDDLSYENKLNKDDYTRVSKLRNMEQKTTAYVNKKSAQQAAQSGAKSSTVVLNGSTFNTTVSSDYIDSNNENTLYQSANTSNFRYFTKDNSATNSLILNLRVGDTLKINDKTYRVSLNQTFTDDADAANTYSNNDPHIAIFFVRDASGYANMITANLVTQ